MQIHQNAKSYARKSQECSKSISKIQIRQDIDDVTSRMSSAHLEELCEKAKLREKAELVARAKIIEAKRMEHARAELIEDKLMEEARAKARAELLREATLNSKLDFKLNFPLFPTATEAEYLTEQLRKMRQVLEDS